MYKTKHLRGFMTGPVFNYLKKTNVSPEFLTLFRIIFGVVTAVVLFFGNYWLSVLFITLAQFVFMLDYVDGPLARYRKSFSKKWQKADMIFHYVNAFLFLIAITASYFIETGNRVFFTIGILGSIMVFYTLLISLTWYGVASGPLTMKEKRKAKKENTGPLTKIYSFFGMDSPFSLFFLFVILDFIGFAIIFFSFLKTIIFIKKILHLQKWKRAKIE